MAGRASNGESTIYKGADGRWHGYVSVGFTLDGKLDRRHVSSKSRGVVVAKVRELERYVRHLEAPEPAPRRPRVRKRMTGNQRELFQLDPPPPDAA